MNEIRKQLTLFIEESNENIEFRELRKTILGQTGLIKEQFPHITLMHPRNSTCTDKIFAEIEKQKFLCEFFFNKITLTEQKTAENGM